MQHKQSAKEWLLITQVKKLTISMLWTYHTQLLAALTFMFEFTISSKSSGLIFGTVFTSSINIRPTELSAGICPCCIQQTEAFHSPTAQFTAYTVHNLHEAIKSYKTHRRTKTAISQKLLNILLPNFLQLLSRGVSAGKKTHNTVLHVSCSLAVWCEAILSC